MAGVTVEQARSARAAAAAAVRIGLDGVASVRMPQLGSVRHGTGEAALRGCPCRPCERVRDDWARGDLVAGPTEPAEPGLVDALVEESPVDAGAGELPVSATAAAGPAPEHLVVKERRVLDLPAELVPVLPPSVSAAVGAAARQVVQGHAVDDTDCARLLLMLGLAAEKDAAAVPGDDAQLDGPAAGEEPRAGAGPDRVDLERAAGAAEVAA